VPVDNDLVVDFSRRLVQIEATFTGIENFLQFQMIAKAVQEPGDVNVRVLCNYKCKYIMYRCLKFGLKYNEIQNSKRRPYV